MIFSKANVFMAIRGGDDYTTSLNYTVFIHERGTEDFLVYVTFTKSSTFTPKDKRRKVETVIVQCVDTFRNSYPTLEEADNSFHYQCLHCFAQLDSDSITTKLIIEGEQTRAN